MRLALQQQKRSHKYASSSTESNSENDNDDKNDDKSGDWRIREKKREMYDCGVNKNGRQRERKSGSDRDNNPIKTTPSWGTRKEHDRFGDDFTGPTGLLHSRGHGTGEVKKHESGGKIFTV